MPAVPLTSVGKLDRKKLRQWIADGSAARAGSGSGAGAGSGSGAGAG